MVSSLFLKGGELRYEYLLRGVCERKIRKSGRGGPIEN